MTWPTAQRDQWLHDVRRNLQTVRAATDWADVAELLTWYTRDVADLLGEIARLEALAKP